MISAFTCLLASFVISGSTESTLDVHQFPSEATLAAIVDSNINGTSLLPHCWNAFLPPVKTFPLGKCSRSPIEALDCSENRVLAVAGRSLSLWDVESATRLKVATTPGHSSTCQFVGPNLVVAAGHDCLLNFYDLRTHNDLPLWSLKIASDNIFTLVVKNECVFAAGADGCVYGVDLRKGYQHTWHLPQDHSAAIVDLKMTDDAFTAVLELGSVVGIPYEPRKKGPKLSSNTKSSLIDDASDEQDVSGDLLFRQALPDQPLQGRIGCDVLQPDPQTLLVAIGSYHGDIHYLEPWLTSPSKAAHLSSAPVISVQWSSLGLFACSENQMSLLPFT